MASNPNLEAVQQASSNPFQKTKGPPVASGTKETVIAERIFIESILESRIFAENLKLSQEIAPIPSKPST